MISNESEANFNDIQSIDKILKRPYLYISSANGKNFRSKLIKAINVWLQIPNEKLQIISEMTEMLHNASLIIDDIEDNSSIRRGIPSAHIVYGIAQTLNSGNFIMFYVLDIIGRKLCDLNSEKDRNIYLEASKIYCEQLLELHRGQGLDIYWRDAFICPTEEQYLDMISKKTGGLFGFSIRLMQLFCDNKNSDILNLINKIGLYFQIRDDYINLKSNDYYKEKGFAEDLTEGKFSFPVIKALKSLSDNQSLINILRKRPEDIETKLYAIQLIEESGAFECTRSLIKQLNHQIRSESQKLGENQYILDIMDYLKMPESQ